MNTGTSKLQPREALLAAVRAVKLGMGDYQLTEQFGEFAAVKARELWRGQHLRQWAPRAEAMAVLTHEMGDAMSKPIERITSAAKFLEALDRHDALQERVDNTLLSDQQLRERAIDDWRRPSRVMVDLIVDAWSDPKEAMIDEILERVLPHWEARLNQLGWFRQ